MVNKSVKIQYHESPKSEVQTTVSCPPPQLDWVLWERQKKASGTGEAVEAEELTHCRGKCKLLGRPLKTLNVETPCDPAVPLEWKLECGRDICITVCCSTIHNSQVMETVQVSTSRWMGEENVGHTQSGVSLNHHEDKAIICDDLDGPERHHLQWNKSSTDWQVVYHLIHVDSDKWVLGKQRVEQ